MIRASFDYFIKNYDLKQKIKIAEIGVCGGFNAKEMFDTLGNDLNRMYLVDNWSLQYNAKSYEWAIMTFKKFDFHKRVIILKTFSHIAAELIENKSLDYCYIDALHNYVAVKQDIKSWYKKVKKGGILAGHDYCIDKPERVQKAVDEIFGKKVITKDIDWWVVC